MRKDILIVDGYNIIFAWPDLKQLSNESLEHARLELRHRLLNFGKHKGYIVILVFDGKYAPQGGSVTAITDDFVEVFTGQHETADSYIEREVFSRKGLYTNVYVCTSDGEEQHQILGFGGLRMSARELKEEIRRDKEEERKHYNHHHIRDTKQLQRNEIFSNLSPEVAEALEALRRGK